MNGSLLKKDMPNDLLLANTDVIKYSMEHIFNQSRNTNVDSYVRDVVASYIYEKFARYGLVAAIHSFSHARPRYEEQGKVSTIQSYEIKSPPWTNLWFRILGIFSVENIKRLCVFMFQT